MIVLLNIHYEYIVLYFYISVILSIILDLLDLLYIFLFYFILLVIIIQNITCIVLIITQIFY